MKQPQTNNNITYYSATGNVISAEKELSGIYGSRYTQYRKEFYLAGNLRYQPRFPLYIMLEQTYRCNLRCASCIHGNPSLRDKFSPGVSCMPWSLFEKIVREGEEYGAPSISMHTNDEPLLVKDLAKRVAFARRHGFMDVILTTNGTLLSDDKIEELVDAGVTRILFSVDAASEATYRRVRGNNLSKVVRAIKKVKEYRKKRKSCLPIVRVSFVPTFLNRHELESFRRKFFGLADYVDIQPLSVISKTSAQLVPSDARRITSLRCNQPYRTLIVRANGDVLPCCSFFGPEIVAGNLRKNSLYRIFNSAFMKELRKDFKIGHYRYRACKNCSQHIYKVNIEEQG